MDNLINCREYINKWIRVEKNIKYLIDILRQTTDKFFKDVDLIFVNNDDKPKIYKDIKRKMMFIEEKINMISFFDTDLENIRIIESHIIKFKSDIYYMISNFNFNRYNN